MKIRVLIVDDEPLARGKIRALLDKEPDIEVLGECGDGPAAVQMILDEKPDLLFLDIQMPELTGFEVLEALEPAQMPVVIFVTAFDQFAIKAFEVHALDYLLKPFDKERFAMALARARALIAEKPGSDLREKILALLAGRPVTKYAERMVLKSTGRIFFVKIGDIDWIEAAGNYVRLHMGAEAHLHRETMASMEEKLDPEKFLRIHRSSIVNFDRIKEIQPFFNGEHVVILQDGTRLTLSRRHRAELDERLSKLV